MEVERVTVLGAGRMGQGLALALRRSGVPALLWGRAQRQVAGGVPLQTGAPVKAIGADGLVLLAVPDSVVTSVAAQLAATGAIGPLHVVLHVSGLLDRSALAPLAATGAALGSFHPLQTIANPESAAARLSGAPAGIEGDERALEAGRALAKRLGMRPVQLTPAQKPAYHAAAVLVANYVVTLVRQAEAEASQAGIPEEEARRLYLPLLAGVTLNLASLPPQEALTGPIRRGDLVTVRRHLEALAPSGRRLYAELGLATVDLAVEAGLPKETAEQLRKVLSAATGR